MNNPNFFQSRPVANNHSKIVTVIGSFSVECNTEYTYTSFSLWKRGPLKIIGTIYVLIQSRFSIFPALLTIPAIVLTALNQGARHRLPLPVSEWPQSQASIQ